MPRLPGLEREELAILLVGFALSAALFLFVRLAGEVTAGETLAFDIAILRMLRDPSDLAQPRGPAWMVSMLIDVTALGSPAVLGLIVLIIAGYLLLER
ncbi:MAG: hypothetical protein QM736_17175, partial [Vicinamibacterales bacterium]